MANEQQTDFSTLEQPYPLKRLFRRRFVPVLLGFVAISLILIGFTAQQVVESIYLELAQQRAQTIARAVDHHAPKALLALMSDQTMAELEHSHEGRALNKAFIDEVRELNLPELKVYNLQRVVLFATHKEEIGSTENGAALRAVIESHQSGLVRRTQQNINLRSAASATLQRRIESFVSTTAIDATRNVNGGDVDKMIGDAVLARFDGDDGGQQAVQAACAIQLAVGQGNFLRALGIGVFRGNVIAGAIGPADRRDFTVVDDSVNISVRLCSATEADQIVVAADLADDSFGLTEEIQVKGRQNSISVRRWLREQRTG